MLKLTNHGIERLYERILTQSQCKTIAKAEDFLSKVLAKGIAKANDTQQMLVVYANNLYIFKKNFGQLLFITVKTTEQHKFDTYAKGKKRSLSYKKNFCLSA